MQKNGTGPLPCTQINSRWIENLNVKLETTDHLEENMSKLLNIDFGNDFFFFFAFDPKSRGNKNKNKQLSLHQTIMLSLCKGNHQQNETHGIEENNLQSMYPVRG